MVQCDLADRLDQWLEADPLRRDVDVAQLLDSVSRRRELTSGARADGCPEPDVFWPVESPFRSMMWPFRQEDPDVLGMFANAIHF